jgi:hypothetical protein
MWSLVLLIIAYKAGYNVLEVLKRVPAPPPIPPP